MFIQPGLYTDNQTQERGFYNQYFTQTTPHRRGVYRARTGYEHTFVLGCTQWTHTHTHTLDTDTHTHSAFSLIQKRTHRHAQARLITDMNAHTHATDNYEHSNPALSTLKSEHN